MQVRIIGCTVPWYLGYDVILRIYQRNRMRRGKWSHFRISQGNMTWMDASEITAATQKDHRNNREDRVNEDSIHDPVLSRSHSCRLRAV